ncbi:MAG: T9SS type A sorting domain-containing protein [Bacteroidota bacterium]|nr:T9SS type A sorting domain-containing protein [Bacteroidota bacterium]
MKIYIILFFCLIYTLGKTQNRNSVWCFGDSAKIDFSDSLNIQIGKSSQKSRGSCASISDTLGSLLFYTSYDPTVLIGGTDPIKVFNNNNQIILNGDSIKGGGWYRELLILPYPGSDTLFYLFNIGVTHDFGLYYSIIDKSSNEIIQKNLQLESFKPVDCLIALKHGNGRDWWILLRRLDSSFNPNNDYYKYLITPYGISQTVQNIGSLNSTNSGRISFNSTGDRMCYINYKGLIELYNFDRCTGYLSTPITISQETVISPWPAYWSAEFSPSDELLYVTKVAQSITDSSKLFQYNLFSPNINTSQITLWTTPWTTTIGQLKKAPNNKIYITTNYYQIYPYQDTMYNSINMNLSTINSPDSLGFACDLQPFGFYLGGARSYVGLPNNPDYDLEALAGSPCDSLTSLSEVTIVSDAELFVYFDTNWQTAFINGNKLTGTKYQLEVFDLIGKSIFRESGNITSPYYTKNLNCAGFAKGMYVVNLVTDKERLVKRFVVR